MRPCKIPVSVLIVVREEAKNLPRCLRALEPFDEIIVIDSNSGDGSEEIARSFGAEFVSFIWNGAYPKKRQWCLDHLSLKHERIFFVDGDEEVTPELCAEISALDWKCAGYFIKGRYVLGGRALKFGLKNNKLCLFDHRMIEFPMIDDLDIEGMGEIEGHYQPVLKTSYQRAHIGQLKNTLLHHALEDEQRYDCKHAGYAAWEEKMHERRAYPRDPLAYRRFIKRVFSCVPRSIAAFLHSYILKAGVLDGREGFLLARKRFLYYVRK